MLAEPDADAVGSRRQTGIVLLTLIFVNNGNNSSPSPPQRKLLKKSVGDDECLVYKVV
jgi:hypothetical protein